MIDSLQVKIDDVMTTLRVALSEAEQIQAMRIALEKSQQVNSEREKRLNETAKTQAQERTDLDAQKKYIEEQNENVAKILEKIVYEKSNLKDLTDQKRILEQEREQLEKEKKELEGIKAEKIGVEREKTSNLEFHRLLVIREANIRAKEEKWDKMERMTEV